MKLKKIDTIFLYPTPPYNFDYSVHDPTHYPAPIVKHEHSKLWFSFRFEKKLLGIKFMDKGTLTRPKIQVDIYSKNQLDGNFIRKLTDEFCFRFRLSTDNSEFYKKFEDDLLVIDVLRKFKGAHGFCIEGLYEYLMIAILLQNANIKRTVQMTNAMLEKYGDKIEFDDVELYSIWKPERILKVPEQELRDLKVGYRAKSFLRASQDYVKLDEVKMRELNDPELRKELLKIYGVGPASVDYLMSGVFNRSVLITIPPWEAKIYSRLLKLDTTDPKKIMAFLDKRYGKWKSQVIGHLFMDIAWKHKEKRIDWMEKLLPF